MFVLVTRENPIIQKRMKHEKIALIKKNLKNWHASDVNAMYLLHDHSVHFICHINEIIRPTKNKITV